MDVHEVIVCYLVGKALDEARLLWNEQAPVTVKVGDPPALPPYWTVVLVLLEEVATILIEQPEGRHGDQEKIPF